MIYLQILHLPCGFADIGCLPECSGPGVPGPYPAACRLQGGGVSDAPALYRHSFSQVVISSVVPGKTSMGAVSALRTAMLIGVMMPIGE